MASGSPISPAQLSSRLQRAISPQLCEHLTRKGWAVADGVFGSDVTSALRTELASLAPSMQHNSTVLVHPASGTSLLPKLAINEAELRDPVCVREGGEGGEGWHSPPVQPAMPPPDGPTGI